MMDSPLLNLILFLLGGALAAAVFWPGRGLFARGRRSRRLASRVALEDALKHIYNHEVREVTCTLTSVAGALEIAASRAVTLVERMQERGLVRMVDGRILLTDEGRRYALEVVRAHRLWERYLADETGVDPLRMAHAGRETGARAHPGRGQRARRAPWQPAFRPARRSRFPPRTARWSTMC